LYYNAHFVNLFKLFKPYIPSILQVDGSEFTINQLKSTKLHKSSSKGSQLVQTNATIEQVDNVVTVNNDSSNDVEADLIDNEENLGQTSGILAYLDDNNSVINEENIDLQISNEFGKNSKRENDAERTSSPVVHYGTVQQNSNSEKNIVNLFRQSDESETNMVNKAFEDI
jgi:hypothetical protein